MGSLMTILGPLVAPFLNVFMQGFGNAEGAELQKKRVQVKAALDAALDMGQRVSRLLAAEIKLNEADKDATDDADSDFDEAFGSG